MNQLTKFVQLAKAGDAHAFSKLYETVYLDLYRFALYTLQHPQDAEDAVSETVVDAFSQISSLREPDAFRAWIFRILSAKCSRRIRQYVNAAEELDESIPAAGHDLAESIDVKLAFSRLSREERLILSMNLFAGYSSQEIGAILNLNPNTVRSRQSRALKKMQAQLS